MGEGVDLLGAGLDKRLALQACSAPQSLYHPQDFVATAANDNNPSGPAVDSGPPR